MYQGILFEQKHEKMIHKRMLPNNASLYASAGKIDITPERNVYIAGYSSNRVSQGVHDRLYARCVAFRSGAQQLALVSCDLIGLLRADIQRIRDGIVSIPSERALISCTHTHSGPDTLGLWGAEPAISGVDGLWLNKTIRSISELVDSTVQKLKPARLRAGSIQEVSDCSRNIRIPEILDRELGAAQLVDASDRSIAVLINFACHPEILNNNLLTADFPGTLCRLLEERTGGEALFFNGALGGMVTADIQRPERFMPSEAWPEAMRIGGILADSAIKAIESGRWQLSSDIQFYRKEVIAPLENSEFEIACRSGMLHVNISPEGNLITEVCCFKVGNAQFVTLPGEALPDIGLRLKRAMYGEPRFLLGLTGDSLGYILSDKDYGASRYSYESSMCVGINTGSILEQTALELVRNSRYVS